MRDRTPTQVLQIGDKKAIRYAVYDEQGNFLRYEFIAPADDPTDEGTLLNKATLLTDETAAHIWPDEETRPEEPTVDGALSTLCDSVEAARGLIPTRRLVTRTKIFTQDTVWPVPEGLIDRAVTVHLFGGGGGGASYGSNGGGGGGGGHRAYETVIVDKSVLSVPITIGAGGAAGTKKDEAGGTGGTTSFGTFLSASGGDGGKSSGGNGGTGGGCGVWGGAGNASYGGGGGGGGYAPYGCHGGNGGTYGGGGGAGGGTSSYPASYGHGGTGGTYGGDGGRCYATSGPTAATSGAAGTNTTQLALEFTGTGAGGSATVGGAGGGGGGYGGKGGNAGAPYNSTSTSEYDHRCGGGGGGGYGGKGGNGASQTTAGRTGGGGGGGGYGSNGSDGRAPTNTLVKYGGYGGGGGGGGYGPANYGHGGDGATTTYDSSGTALASHASTAGKSGICIITYTEEIVEWPETEVDQE